MKDAGKLVVKCILALVPLWIICIFIAKSPLSYLSGDSVSAYWNKEFTQAKQEKYYDVVILGDSMAATSFVPELLSDSTINLALSGSSPVEGYYTLKDYLDNNEAPTDVFVSYMDYHLAHDDFTFATCNQVHKFSLNDYVEIYKTIKNTGAIQFEDLPIDSYWQKAVASSFYLPSEYIASIINAIKDGGRATENKGAYDNISLHYGRACRMTNDISNSTGLKYDEFSVSSLQWNYYSRIVDLCESNGIKLHVIKLPLDYNTLFTDEYVAQVNGFYMNIFEDSKLAEFRWYPADYATELFWDDYHMNQHGAYRFSMQMKLDYPELWGSHESTPEQMKGLNEYLLIENTPSELFKWIDAQNYTVLICNNQSLSDNNDIEGMFNAFLKNNKQSIEKIDNSNLYCITGNNDKLDFKVANNGNSVSIVLNEEYKIELSEDAINVIVIDDSNKEIVLHKKFYFNQEEYTISELE